MDKSSGILMQKVLILSAEGEDDFEATHISSEDSQYVVFNDIEYAAGYLYATKKENKPDMILIDHDLDLIERFVSICTEINVDISKYKLITNTGDSFNQIDVKKQKFVYINPVGDSDSLDLLSVN